MHIPNKSLSTTILLTLVYTITLDFIFILHMEFCLAKLFICTIDDIKYLLISHYTFEPSIALARNLLVNATCLLISEDMVMLLPEIHVARLNINHLVKVKQNFDIFLYFFSEMRFLSLISNSTSH
jgi:hypothetical protein